MKGAQRTAAIIHRCEYCQKQFPTNYRLKYHRKIHLMKTDFECSFCGFLTNFKPTLFDHVRSHIDERPYKCQHPNCKMAFRLKSILKQHQFVHLKDNESVFKFKCSKCPFKTERKGTLKKHVLTHSDVKNFSCGHCPFRSKYKRSLQGHCSSRHPTEPPMKLTCQEPNCALDFPNKKKFRRHQLIHSRDDESLFKFKCSQCPYKTLWSETLHKHVKTHSVDRPFSCDLCPKKYTHKKKLDVHKEVHLQPKAFKCPMANCSYSDKERSNLKSHMQAHKAAKSFACSFPSCNFKTKKKSGLKTHEMTHRNEKPFKCGLCPAALRTKHALFGHIRRHTGETPFPCQSCPYQARRVESLARHVEKHHSKKQSSSGDSSNNQPTKTRPLKCKVEGCNFATEDDSSLALHLNASHDLPKVVMAMEEVSFAEAILLKCKVDDCIFTARKDSILAGHLNTNHHPPKVSVAIIEVPV